MKRSVNIRRFIILVILLPLFVTATGCRLFPKEEVEDISALVAPVKKEIVTYKIAEGPIREEFDATAEVSSSRQDKLWFTIPGLIAEVMVESDDDVRKGQPLVRLQTGDLNFGIRRAEALLEQQELLYEEKYNDNELKKQAPDFYQKRLAEINIKCAKIELERLQRQLKDSVLVAPFSGRITSLTAERGKPVEAFSQLALITDTRTLELTSSITEDKANRIKRGTRVKVHLDKGEYQMATVHTVEHRDNLWIAHLRLDNAHFPYKLDDNYQVTFWIRSVEKTLVVPNDAVREDFNGNKYLRVLDGKRRRELYVKVGIQTDTQTQILEGAKAGMTVIGK